MNGDDGNDGSSERPYKTIRAATGTVIKGDVIHVAPGTYGAAEDSQTATSLIGTRVVIPEGVTVESTGGAEKTFIVGAAATGDQIDNATYGTGTNAVRCVYANEGATLRGFTLTGGRTIGVADGDGAGSAFYSVIGRGATVEDCIISNNVGHNATIRSAVVRRCHVTGNTCTMVNNGQSGSAGTSCNWYNCIIEKNRGNGTCYVPLVVENCTFGDGNKLLTGSTSAQVFFYWSGVQTIKNCAVLYGRYYHSTGTGRICFTNCLVMANDVTESQINVEGSYNTIFTNSSAARVDSGYRPILGSFAGIDAGDASVSSAELGDTDFYGTPRILNGLIDIGAVEYDWRPTFNQQIGKRFTLTYASPSVTTNAAGGLLFGVDGDSVDNRPSIAGTAISAGAYEFRFEMTGGSAQVYVGGVLAGEASGTGEQSIQFNVPDTTSEIRFTFTPDELDPGAVLLRKFAGARGFSVTVR